MHPTRPAAPHPMQLFATTRLHAEPIAFAQAAAFVARHHRHNAAPVGHIFSVGCYYDGALVGVAICGRPVSRRLDTGKALEVTRVCTTGQRNACSKLYAACVKYARLRGYQQVLTYTLVSETGASVRAANFRLDAAGVGGKAWNGRTAFAGVPELKNRWIYAL